MRPYTMQGCVLGSLASGFPTAQGSAVSRTQPCEPAVNASDLSKPLSGGAGGGAAPWLRVEDVRKGEGWGFIGG